MKSFFNILAQLLYQFATQEPKRVRTNTTTKHPLHLHFTLYQTYTYIYIFTLPHPPPLHSTFRTYAPEQSLAHAFAKRLAERKRVATTTRVHHKEKRARLYLYTHTHTRVYIGVYRVILLSAFTLSRRALFSQLRPRERSRKREGITGWPFYASIIRPLRCGRSYRLELVEGDLTGFG